MTDYKYIIMCGSNGVCMPKHLNIVNGEYIIVRTIRLLKEAGITDLYLSTNNPIFEQFGLPILHHENNWEAGGMWSEAFYPTDDPVCYICGDVVFSPEAIKTIIETDTDDVEFFASAPPFAENYIKPYAEPFAFKVRNQQHFRQALAKVRELHDQFHREPIAWEVWQVVKGTPINHIDYANYTVINDYTCDVDLPKDADKFNELVFHCK